MNIADCLTEEVDDSTCDVVSGESTAKWQDLLIELVKARPGLYDPAQKDNATDRNAIWTAVAAELRKAGFSNIKNVETDAETTRKKWESLRDTFRKYTIQMERGKRPKTYVYADQMSFLRPMITNSITPNSDPDMSTVGTEERNCEPKIEQMTVKSSPKSHSRHSIQVSHKRKKRRMSPPTRAADKSTRYHQPTFDSSRLVTNAMKTDYSYRDADYNFGQVVIDHLRDIPDGRSKDKVKLAMLQLIIETKYGTC